MPDGLYERDALAWAERQADLLRRLAAGERLNEAVDWPNVIEEVQDVGLSELRACKSLLRQALVHLLKLYAWPGSTAAAHWRSEVIGFRADMRDRFAPSMRQRISLDEIYRVALEQVQAGTDNSGEPRPVPAICPFVLDDFLWMPMSMRWCKSSAVPPALSVSLAIVPCRDPRSDSGEQP